MVLRNACAQEGKHIGGVSSVDLPTLVDPDFSSVLIHFSASSFAGMLAYRLDIMWFDA